MPGLTAKNRIPATLLEMQVEEDKRTNASSIYLVMVKANRTLPA